MKTGLQKLNKWDGIVLSFSALSFVFCVLTVLDTVRATGTGYFMFLGTGMLTRESWDIVCAVFILVLIFILVLAATYIMHGSLTDAAFFFIANGALTEYVRPDKILAPFTGGDVLDRYGVFFRIVDYLPMYLTGIIFLLLMLMAGDGEKYKGMVIKASAASGILITLSLIINNAFELFLFAAGYVLLFPLIALGAGKEKRAFVPASAVFFVCMIWRLYSAMALY